MTRRGRAIAMTISIAHEIGHILGAPRPPDRSEQLAVPLQTRLRRREKKWCDIMSYAENSDGCVRIPY
jgi:hypothetical protein